MALSLGGEGKHFQHRSNQSSFAALFRSVLHFTDQGRKSLSVSCIITSLFDILSLRYFFLAIELSLHLHFVRRRRFFISQDTKDPWPANGHFTLLSLVVIVKLNRSVFFFMRPPQRLCFLLPEPRLDSPGDCFAASPDLLRCAVDDCHGPDGEAGSLRCDRDT